MFFLNKNFTYQFFKKLLKEVLILICGHTQRVDTVREDQLALFKKAGVNWLCLGIEAGNQVVRKDIEKGRFKDVNIREVAKMINSYDINILGNYIFGLPEDSIKTMNETLDLALDLNTEHANFYPAQALPGSPLYFGSKKNNWDMPKNF